MHMNDYVRGGESLSPQQYRSWIVAEELLGNSDKAYELASRWHQLEPENEAARRALGELANQLFQAGLELPNPDIERLTDYFLQVVELGDDPKVSQELFASLYLRGVDQPVAGQVVDHIVNSTRTPATILEAAGTAAATMGNNDKAKIYLLRAVKKDAGNPVALNNYAWILTQDPHGDMDIALTAVNKALEIQPDDVRFHETRGQVLVRLGRWREAIEDLEIAVNGLPDVRDIHLSLAKAYDALGEEQLARVHRARATIE
jgi:tetratricopeptide (TPR) repeat protein